MPTLRLLSQLSHLITLKDGETETCLREVVRLDEIRVAEDRFPVSEKYVIGPRRHGPVRFRHSGNTPAFANSLTAHRQGT